jgi:hypothetical protein
MRKSFVNNTFWLFGAALALSLKSAFAGAQAQAELRPLLPGSEPAFCGHAPTAWHEGHFLERMG